MVVKLSDEIREALRTGDGAPVRIDDEQMMKSFVLIEMEDYRRLVDDRVRREIEIGLQEVERGETAPWNLQEFLHKAHQMHQQANGED